jgi:hypothetical protein
MDATEVNTGARSALSALKETYKIGKEGAQFIGEIQADNHATVRSAQKQRVEERKHVDALSSAQEQRAYKKMLNKFAAATATSNLKSHIITDYGDKAWIEYERLKKEVEKEDLADAKLMKGDLKRINELFWWCMVASSIIVYVAGFAQ